MITTLPAEMMPNLYNVYLMPNNTCIGTVYNDNRFTNGASICTSEVLHVIPDQLNMGFIVVTNNTCYWTRNEPIRITV